MVEQPEIDWEEYSDHRTPGISIRQLLQRGGDSHLEFNLVRFAGDDFHAPRHRHNFDQFRIGLAGVTKYGRRERLSARTVGYYPEGTWYGPTTVEEPSIQAILQLDGPSRLGYINYIGHDEAVAELKTRGEFRDGYYYPADGGPRVDGYQAGWEQATGRELIYPEPRFEFPIYMAIDAFEWVDGPDRGTRRKQLGTFGERGTGVEVLELSPGSSAQIAGGGRTIVGFVLAGSLTTDQEQVDTWGALLADGPDPLTITGGNDTTEVVLVHFPVFDGG